MIKVLRVNRISNKKKLIILAILILLCLSLSILICQKVLDNQRIELENNSKRAEYFISKSEPIGNTKIYTESVTALTKNVNKDSKKVSKKIIKEEEKRIREEEEKDKTKRFLKALDEVAENMEKNGFWYSNSRNSSTYEKALNSHRVSNCARYVSWALQEAGIVNNEGTFWINDHLHETKSCITKNEFLEVSYPHKKAKDLNLKPGDIVGWNVHTTVYAGTNDNGQMLWYSAGKGGASKAGGKWYFKKDKIVKQPHGSYANRTVAVLIRVKKAEGN